MAEELTRETLRAELGALELRLVDRISTALAAKADISHVNSVESRLAAIELHGSPGLVTVQEAVRQNTAKLAEIRLEQESRGYLVEQVKADHGKLRVLGEDFIAWRNRFVGGAGVLSLASALLAARVFLGF